MYRSIDPRWFTATESKELGYLKTFSTHTGVYWDTYSSLGGGVRELTVLLGEVLESFRIDDGSENVILKWIRLYSNFVAFIPIHWKCEIKANFLVVDFLGTGLKFRKRTKIRRRLFTFSITRRFATTIFSVTQRCNIVATLFRIVTTLFQHCNAVLHFHVAVVQWRERNVQKSVTHVQSCCFANQTYCFFANLAAVAVVKALELWLSLLIISKHLFE